MREELVISAAGVVTAAGVGLEAHAALVREPPVKRERSLRGFRARDHLSDPRILKAVSGVDAFALVAIETLKAHGGITAATATPERTGLFVGSPSADINNNENYREAMVAGLGGDGRVDLAAFGRASMEARPTTLLLGLPNNGLAYGAMLLDARGPHSNYVAAEVSAHWALIQAARRLQRGQLDLAVAGGYAGSTAAPAAQVLARGGYVGEEATLADGAVFVAIETRARAEARGAKVLATYLAGATSSEASGPVCEAADGRGLAGGMRRALAAAGVEARDVGLVLGSGGAHALVDARERAAATAVLGGDVPFRTIAAYVGSLIEAGGVLEVALLAAMRAAEWLAPGRCAVILRGSAWGEGTVVVVR